MYATVVIYVLLTRVFQEQHQVGNSASMAFLANYSAANIYLQYGLNHQFLDYQCNTRTTDLMKYYLFA